VLKACKNLQSFLCVSLQYWWRISKTKEIKLMQEKYRPLHTKAGNKYLPANTCGQTLKEVDDS